MVKNRYNLVPVPSVSRKRDENEPMPGSSGIGRKVEDGEDFSASSSDWLPNDDDIQSSDSEEELIVTPIQLERRYQRHYSRPNNTVTPLNKAKAVPRNVRPPKILQQIQNTLNGSVKKSSVTSNTQKMAELKKSLGPKELSNDEMNSNSFTLQPQEESDEDKENFNDDISVHEEFNKSGDNVLISNKYKNVTVKLMKKKQKKVADNEGMIVTPIQSERRYQRHFTRPNKTIVTPLNKAKAVRRNVSPRKILQQIQNTLNGSVKKSSVDSNMQRSSWNLSASPRVIHMNSNAVNRIINTMSIVLETMAKLKKSLGSKEQSNDEMNSKSFTLQPQEVSDENEENFNDDISVHEEFNNPGDNVLISNRYEKVTVKPKKKRQKKVADNEGKIPIGCGTTLVDKELFNKVNWKSYTVATRSLLVAVFKRKELATRSLSGRPSPVFQNRRPKICLDQRKIADIISEITDRFNVKKNEVRHVITTKCADECKRLRLRRKNAKQNRAKGVSSPQSAQMNARCGKQETRTLNKIDVKEKVEESEE